MIGGLIMTNVFTNEVTVTDDVLLSNEMMVINSQGKVDIAPSLKPIVDALHEVLAGGEVKIELTLKGDPEKKSFFERRMQKVLSSSTFSEMQSSALSP